MNEIPEKKPLRKIEFPRNFIQISIFCELTNRF